MYDFYDSNFEGAKQSAPSETECAHSKPEHACIPLEKVHFSVDTHTQTLDYNCTDHGPYWSWVLTL